MMLGKHAAPGKTILLPLLGIDPGEGCPTLLRGDAICRAIKRVAGLLAINFREKKFYWRQVSA